MIVTIPCGFARKQMKQFYFIFIIKIVCMHTDDCLHDNFILHFVVPHAFVRLYPKTISIIVFCIPWLLLRQLHLPSFIKHSIGCYFIIPLIVAHRRSLPRQFHSSFSRFSRVSSVASPPRRADSNWYHFACTNSYLKLFFVAQNIWNLNFVTHPLARSTHW